MRYEGCDRRGRSRWAAFAGGGLRGEVRLRRRPGAAARRVYVPGSIEDETRKTLENMGHAVRAGGQLHDGVYVPGSIEDETRQTLENMGTLLVRAGSGFEHVVRCGVWLVDLDDFPGMNGDGSSRAP